MNEHRFKILLVEDNSGDIYLIRKALTEAHVAFDATILNDGAQALAFVRGEGTYADIPIPDLVLLDLNLPKNEGIQVLAAIRQSQRFGAVPVIVTSSSHSPRDQSETARLGIECYLRKPSDLAEFMKIGTILKEVLNRNARLV